MQMYQLPTGNSCDTMMRQSNIMENLMNKNAKAFVSAATEVFGPNAVITRDDIQAVVENRKVPYPFWFVTRQEFRAGRGSYRLPDFPDGNPVVVPVQTHQTQEAPQPTATVEMSATVHVLRQKRLQDDVDVSIPEKYDGYVPFGFYKDLLTIIQSRNFFPVFITGLSGNGKTLMVEQVCANLKRECIRVNVSIETDESDLIGGPTLIDGNVVYRDGPVITAMKRGAILLIDEIDRGSNKLMCLQGILEGKPYFNKKSGEYIHPSAGFNIVATANTKGRGSEEGKYLSQILDDAFLERFNITVEQQYPESRVELKILKPLLNDNEFAENLVKWADVIRKTFNEGGVDEIISTRRLVHIAKTYSIFKDRQKAIQLCVNRFDEETKLAFLDLYSKVDVKVAEANTATTATNTVEKDPF
jgi:cobaltochelatase CobS